MAVPESLTALDKAREAISESTDSPNRGSCSKVRRTPMLTQARTLLASGSSPSSASWLARAIWTSGIPEIGRAHDRTPVTNAHIVCRSQIEKNKTKEQDT